MSRIIYSDSEGFDSTGEAETDIISQMELVTQDLGGNYDKEDHANVALLLGLNIEIENLQTILSGGRLEDQQSPGKRNHSETIEEEQKFTQTENEEVQNSTDGEQISIPLNRIFVRNDIPLRFSVVRSSEGTRIKNLIKRMGGLVEDTFIYANFRLAYEGYVGVEGIYYSQQYVIDCYHDKQFKDIENYRIVVNELPNNFEVVKKIKKTHQFVRTPAKKKRRNLFTEDDRKILTEYLTRHRNDKSMTELFTEISVKYPHHTLGSWRTYAATNVIPHLKKNREEANKNGTNKEIESTSVDVMVEDNPVFSKPASPTVSPRIVEEPFIDPLLSSFFDAEEILSSETETSEAFSSQYSTFPIDEIDQEFADAIAPFATEPEKNEEEILNVNVTMAKEDEVNDDTSKEKPSTEEDKPAMEENPESEKENDEKLMSYEVLTPSRIRNINMLTPSLENKQLFVDQFNQFCAIHKGTSKHEILAALHMSGGYFKLATRILEDDMQVDRLEEKYRMQVFTYEEDLALLLQNVNAVAKLIFRKGDRNVSRRIQYLEARESLISQ